MLGPSFPNVPDDDLTVWMRQHVDGTARTPDELTLLKMLSSRLQQAASVESLQLCTLISQILRTPATVPQAREAASRQVTEPTRTHGAHESADTSTTSRGPRQQRLLIDPVSYALLCVCPPAGSCVMASCGRLAIVSLVQPLSTEITHRWPASATGRTGHR